MTQMIDEKVDDSINTYLHILKLNDACYLVPSLSFKSYRLFKSFNEALAYCYRLQKTQRCMILLHDSNGLVVDVFRPRLKVLSFNETSSKRNVGRPSKARAISTNG